MLINMDFFKNLAHFYLTKSYFEDILYMKNINTAKQT